MKTSGVGRGGALILAAGAVAVGITGCGGSDNKSVAVQNAAAGSTAASSATDTVTPPAPSTAPSPAPTTPTTLPSTTATHVVTPTKTKPTTKPSSKPTTKPKSSTTGTGWLAGVPLGHNTPGKLDPRCMTGRTICIDMSTRTLLWVVNGKVQYGMDVRFGDENNPTRKGQWTLYSKQKNCISNLYHTSMPDAMFFSGGEAVHFSADFAKYGYAHHSHGCVNVRDRAAVDRLFADARVGDKVVVY